MYSNDSGHLSSYCHPLGAGAFCRAFTTNVAPQCRAFSRALEFEKLKAPLFRGPEGAGDTNDWWNHSTGALSNTMICKQKKMEQLKWFLSFPTIIEVLYYQFGVSPLN